MATENYQWQKNQTLLIIDGNSLINRAFYGMPSLSTKSGQPTNAILGFLNIMERELQLTAASAVCVTFDAGRRTFRTEMYEQYKAQRKPMPDALRSQFPYLQKILSYMNIATYSLPGWEADDLIGTLSSQAEEQDWHVEISTSDKDALQLATGNIYIRLATTKAGQRQTVVMTPESFWNEYGFNPINLIDLKALMGDKSDNIPGAKGIGETTAKDLIRRFETVQNLYSLLPSLEGTLKKGVISKLKEGRADVELSYQLATIRCDAPVIFDEAKAALHAPNREKLIPLLRELELKSILEKYC